LAFVNGCVDVLDQVLVFLVQVGGGEFGEFEQGRYLQDFCEH
jgi:hypothetical protein